MFTTRTHGFDGGRSGYAGASTVAVAEGVPADVTVTLTSAARLLGRVVIEQTRSGTSAPQSVTVAADPADGSPRLWAPRNLVLPAPPDWTFTLDGFSVGEYLIGVRTAAPWILRSAISGGRDYADEAFTTGAGALPDMVITVTDAGATIAGSVRTVSGSPTAPGGVIAFPANREYWTKFGLHPRRIKATPTGPDGRYQLPPLPAGEYYLLAVGARELRSWQEPGFFEAAASRATRVSVGWGESATMNLRWEPQ
jgi:hypothetical protein